MENKTNSRHVQESSIEYRQVEDGYEEAISKVYHNFPEFDAQILSHFKDNYAEKEEKKKSTKKRKEEKYIKEKNIPFGNNKKENFISIPFDQVQISDVSDWAKEELPRTVNLAWELNKFKDHWLASSKKFPKDGVAAFRNWLRKSVEINNKYGVKNEKFSKPNGSATSFERFLAGGARALTKF